MASSKSAYTSLMGHPRLLCWLALLVVVGCGPEPTPRMGGSPDQRSPAVALTVERDEPSPADTSPAPSTGWPAASSETRPSEDCAVALQLEIREVERQRVLRVYAKNRTAERLEFSIPERCPNGPVDFEGLPSGYDYYGTCAAGACADWPATRQITLAPGASQPLAEARVFIDGRAPCTGAIPPGQYTVRPVAPPTNVSLCVTEATLVVPEPPSEREVAEARKDPYFCVDSSECVLSCPVPHGCCGNPCGCRHAINVQHRAAYEAEYARSCSRPPCPAVGCAYEPAYFAVCRNNRCQGASNMSGF